MKMSKMGSHDPFGHLKHKLWPKKGRESIWQFDSRSLKVRNRPDFLVCRWHATHHWKAFDEAYNFALSFISIRGLHTKLQPYKVVGVPILAISGLPLGSFGTKSHLDVGLMERHREPQAGREAHGEAQRTPSGEGGSWRGIEYTIRGKVVASPKSRLW